MDSRLKKISLTIISVIITLIISLIFILTSDSIKHNIFSNISDFKNASLASSTPEEFIYLSDIPYLEEESYNGWAGHNIGYDQGQEGGSISLLVDGARKYFKKGLSIHAKGQVVYDISELSDKYTRFLAYFGVDRARGDNGSLWIEVSASIDGSSWTQLKKTDVLTGASPAVQIDVDIKGAKYLKIYVDPNGSNGADHAVVGKPRLATASFDKNTVFYDGLLPISSYDDILKTHTLEENYTNPDLYNIVLKREIVNKLGYANIQEFAEFNTELLPALTWYLGSNEKMEQLIEVGEITNTEKFLKAICEIYNNNPEIFSSNKSMVYLKMAIALGAAYSSNGILSPISFSTSWASYDYVERFNIIKKLYDSGQFMMIPGNNREGEFVANPWFESLHIELMRNIMDEGMTNAEIPWLNGYTHAKNSLHENLAPYIHPNYARPEYYDQSNYETYNNKYMLGKYNIPYGDDKVRYWMVFENGGICWNQSRIAQSMWKVNGLPAFGAYQPAHEMYYTYWQDENGKGFWSPRYGNWGKSATLWYGGNRYRYIFNWAGKSFADQNITYEKWANSSGYLYLAQANLNNYENYKKSLYYNLIANSYDNDKKIETYFQSLEVNKYNLDTFDYLINLYSSLGKTEADWYNLALKVTDSYAYFPVALHDLLKVIRPHLSGANKLDIDRKETSLIKGATTISSETAKSVGAVNAEGGIQTHAKELLGLNQPDPVSFAFDGEDAGKLILHDNYDIGYSYSLDGGTTFNEYTTERKVTLSDEELSQINAENDIIIRFMGLTNTFTIDITKAVIPATLFGSDLENKLVGDTSNLEWRLKGKDNWTKLSNVTPDLTGNKTLEVRVGYNSHNIPSDIVTYTFTLDTDTDTHKYVSISSLTLEDFSTQQLNRDGAATNALDANYNTRYHSSYWANDTERYLTIRLNKPKYISAVDFVPCGGSNGKILDGVVYGSMDGTSWTKLSELKNLSYTTSVNSLSEIPENIKRFEIDNPEKVGYIKIVATRATGGNYFTARAINLYEDITAIKIADFSFDGADAGVLKLTEEYDGQNWAFSLDGGSTWEKVLSSKRALSDEEIAKITPENGIKVKIIDTSLEVTIKTKKADIPNINPYASDLENKLLGLNESQKATLEWKLEGGPWHSYNDIEPEVSGTKSLYVRTKGTRNIAPSDALVYQFTKNSASEKRKYISINHLHVHEYSSQSIDTRRPYYATNAIDGNPNTLWHTDFRYSVLEEETKPFITLKLDEAKYLSGIEFKQTKYRDNDPDYIKNARVYISEDGTTWQKAGEINNLLKDTELRTIDLANPVYGQYVKIEMDTYSIFASLSLINLYEDTTKKTSEEKIEYDVTSKTNQNVVATIKSDSNIIITNNSGKSAYTFTENGSFTFKYLDKNGKAKTKTAIVDWIDKEAPTATLTYSTVDYTSKPVTVTLNPSEDVTITNNDGNNTYTFYHDGDFTFTFVDEAGNEGSAKAEVDYIVLNAIEGEVEYSTKKLINKDVTASLIIPEGVRVINNGGKTTYTFTENGSFTFTFMDEEGNIGSKTVEVTWIDKTVPSAVITYSTTSKTTENVIATITSDEEIIILNNNGKSSYTFTENGHFTFNYEDLAGNKGTLESRVNWITKYTPPGLGELPVNPDDDQKGDEVTYIPIQNPIENKPTTGNNTKPSINIEKPSEVDEEKTSTDEEKIDVSDNKDESKLDNDKKDDTKKEQKVNSESEKEPLNYWVLIISFFFGLSLIYLGFKGRNKD